MSQSMLCFLKILLGVFIVFVKAHLDILSLHFPDEPYYWPPLTPSKEGRTGLLESWESSEGFCWGIVKHCQLAFPQVVKLLLPFRGDGREVNTHSIVITDPLYLPLKRGGQVCLPLESVMVRRNKSVFIYVIRGRLIIRGEWYSLGNISLDLFSHRLHGFSQIFCCLGNSCLQMSGCVVRRNKSVFICGIRGRIKLIIRGSAICGRHDLSSVGLISV